MFVEITITLPRWPAASTRPAEERAGEVERFLKAIDGEVATQEANRNEVHVGFVAAPGERVADGRPPPTLPFRQSATDRWRRRNRIPGDPPLASTPPHL